MPGRGVDEAQRRRPRPERAGGEDPTARASRRRPRRARGVSSIVRAGPCVRPAVAVEPVERRDAGRPSQAQQRPQRGKGRKPEQGDADLAAEAARDRATGRARTGSERGTGSATGSHRAGQARSHHRIRRAHPTRRSSRSRQGPRQERGGAPAREAATGRKPDAGAGLSLMPKSPCASTRVPAPRVRLS